MSKIKLLDCTIRDGGYVNDWNFGHNNLISIYERLIDSDVDYIELGFLDERREFDINRSIMPDTFWMETLLLCWISLMGIRTHGRLTLDSSVCMARCPAAALVR